MSLHELMIAIDNKEVERSQSLLFDLIKNNSEKNSSDNIFNDNYLIGTVRAIFKRNLVDPILLQFIEGFSLSHIDIYSLLLLVNDKLLVEDFDMLFDKYQIQYSTIFQPEKNEDSQYSFMTFLKWDNNFFPSLKKYGFLNGNNRNNHDFMNQLTRNVIYSKNHSGYFISFYQEYGRAFLRSYHDNFIKYGEKKQYEEYQKFLLSLGRLDTYILLNDTFKKINTCETLEFKEKAIYFHNYLEKIILNKQLHQGLGLYKKEKVKINKI